MVLWVGIICPVAEEVIFRMMVYLRLRDNLRVVSAVLISGIMFGIYHGNLAQAVYASLIGFVFAIMVEYTERPAASVFMHIGANTWTLFISEVLIPRLDSLPETLQQVIMWWYCLLEAGFLLLIVCGTLHFRKKYRNNRA